MDAAIAAAAGQVSSTVLPDDLAKILADWHDYLMSLPEGAQLLIGVWGFALGGARFEMPLFVRKVKG